MQGVFNFTLNANGETLASKVEGNSVPRPIDYQINTIKITIV